MSVVAELAIGQALELQPDVSQSGPLRSTNLTGEPLSIQPMPMMVDEGIRALIDRHSAASVAGDSVLEHDIYQSDVVCEYPPSGEVVHARQTLQTLRGRHPDKPPVR